MKDEKKIKDKMLRDNRNKRGTYIATEYVECDIVIVGQDPKIWGAEINIDTDDGFCVFSIYGKSKNGAIRMAREILDRMEVQYRIKK